MKLGELGNADCLAAPPLLLNTNPPTQLPCGEQRALVGRTSKRTEKQDRAWDL